MATVSSYVKTVERGGFPALGPKVGMIEVDITIADGVSANDRVEAFTFDAKTLVMAAGIQVTTASTNAVTASLGLASQAAGSATDFSGELAVNAAADLVGGAAKANVLAPAADTMVAEVSGDTGSATVIRVWAIIADIGDVSGA